MRANVSQSATAPNDETEFLDLLNSLPEAVFQTDNRGCLVFLSEGWKRLTGWEPEECLGKTMIEFLMEEYRESTSQHIGKLMRGELRDELRLHEMRLEPRSRTPKWVRVSFRALRADDGTCMGISGCVAELEEQKRIERKLELHQMAVRSMEDAVIITDQKQPDGPVVYVNPAFQRLTGWLPSEVIGRNPCFLEGPETDERELQTVRQALASGKSCKVTLKYHRKDGGTFWNRLHLAPIHDPEGRVAYYVGSLMDMTERLQIESELRSALEQITASARHKASFLAAMSHELRTPLHAILGSTEILGDGMLGEINDRQREHVQNIAESGDHLLNLINDVLDLSKIEAGKEELQFQETDPNGICEAGLMLVQQMADEKGIRLKFESSDAIGQISADPRRLKQILVNLLSNAIKFTASGGSVGIKVATFGESNEVRFEVWDTGIGIRAEDHSRLFQPFVQLQDALTRDQSGIGLGLSLVGQLVDLHGGRIKLDSEVGQGSRFSVILPVLPRHNQTDSCEKNTEQHENQGKDQRDFNRRILLAEDNEFNQDTISTFLKTNGYDVTIARDGWEAVRLATELQPDIIIMDVQMPRMDGIEATRRLRAELATENTPIIALTALAMPGDREKCLEVGMDDYFAKPIRLNILMQKIESRLR